MTDQNDTVHEYHYDGLGRRTADQVTTVGAGIDDGRPVQKLGCAETSALRDSGLRWRRLEATRLAGRLRR